MDQVKKTPNVLLLRRTETEEESASWQRLFKALKGFTQAAMELRDETITVDEINEIAGSFDHVVVDHSLLEPPKAVFAPSPKILLAAKDPIPWNDGESRSAGTPVLTAFPCLVLHELSGQEMIRILHLFFSTKRQAGVTPLLEKNSLIVAEKIQSLDAIGSLTDKLCVYFSRMENFALQERIPELRQLLPAVLTQAFRQASLGSTPYPTVDFQVGMNRQKVLVNLRFPKGTLSLASIRSAALKGEDIFWQQAWACCDVFLLTEHVQYQELELMLVLTKPASSPRREYRSFLAKESPRSQKKEYLLNPVPHFEFRVLSDIRLKETGETSAPDGEAESGPDLGSLPEEVVEKIETLSRENEFFREQTSKKDALVRDALSRATSAKKQLARRETEFLRQEKAFAAKAEILLAKIDELEKSTARASDQKASAAPSPDSAALTKAQEAMGRLEQSLKATENEKSQLSERVAREEKKSAALEQKYSTLYKDLSAKDKELVEAKANLLKLKKEALSAAAAAKSAAASSGVQGELTAKLKEMETRETALKQEMRKISFKLENHEKNVKAIQQEAQEKSKLLEQKLQTAKAKELELLKKIDDLSALLKKVSKAA
jgi:hypothetical protein